MPRRIRRRHEEAPANSLDRRFGYDLRKGAAGYAPIVGTIGGFVVTGVVLVFDIASDHKNGEHVEHASMLGRATALLVLGLIACLLAAFALAAIGAERGLTPNLTAATLYVGVTTVIGVVAIIGAFEVLSSIYLRNTRSLFALITACTAIGGSVLVTLVLGDAWSAQDLPRSHWLGTQAKAARWASLLAVGGAALLGAVTALYFFGLRLKPDTHTLHVIIGTGIVLAFLSGIASMLRTMHAPDGGGKRWIRRYEAIGTLVILNLYLALFLLVMP